MKKLHIILIAFLIVIISIFSYLKFGEVMPTSEPITQAPQEQASFDGKNSSFIIDSELITLVNGKAETSSAPGSASKNTFTYFGNEATGDLSGDLSDDIAFLVSKETGGSGTFYYVVAAVKNASGYKTTNAFFIGDRISPQSTEIKSKELLVNFAERREGEPMTTPPSQGATLLLKVTPDGVLEGLMK